jgi:hypothetical protein
MSRPGDRFYPGSPPRNVTPSKGRRSHVDYNYNYHDDYYARSHRPPLVYQIYGGACPLPRESSMSRGFPGCFSPVRVTSRQDVYSPPRNNTFPKSESEDSLYASFSPPRRVQSRPTPSTQPNHFEEGYSPKATDESIFRPKQSCIIVARDRSNDDSSVSYGSKHTPTPGPSAAVKDIPQIRNQVSSFPMKLHEILSSPEYESIVTWLPHGRAWRVLKPKAFEEKIIPKFFRSSKYASFMRQVNGWGFKRITSPGPDFNAYWHELFLRGLPDLCAKMKRPPAKGQDDPDTKQAPTEDPDFYRISSFAPVPLGLVPDHPDAPPGDFPGVDRSASFSSISCELPAKDQGISPYRSRNGRAGRRELSSMNSWDIGHRSNDIAINLTGVYEKEAKRHGMPKSEGQNQLSDSDLHYLARQNRFLIKQAHAYQERPNR